MSDATLRKQQAILALFGAIEYDEDYNYKRERTGRSR